MPAKPHSTEHRWNETWIRGIRPPLSTPNRRTFLGIAGLLALQPAMRARASPPATARNAIIIHGMAGEESYFADGPSWSHRHWLPWLQRELLRRRILAQTPEMPEPYRPDYGKWKELFDRFPVDGDTILVGHSCGAGFLVRRLSEPMVRVGKVALVAPWMDPAGKRAPAMFAGFVPDPFLVARTAGVGVFFSSDDGRGVLATVANLRARVGGLQVLEFAGRGHFISGEFPELRDWLLAP